MFNLSNDIIIDIIGKAREISMQDELFMPGDYSSPDADESEANLAENKDDLTAEELESVINELEPDQQKELLALFFVGNGDYDTTEWKDALKEAANIPKHERTNFLLAKPMLADLLEEGLAKFGHSTDK